MDEADETVRAAVERELLQLREIPPHLVALARRLSSVVDGVFDPRESTSASRELRAVMADARRIGSDSPDYDPIEDLRDRVRRDDVE